MNDIEKEIERALEKDASMLELIDAMHGKPLMQHALRLAFKVGFGAGALHEARKASEMLRSPA